MCVRKYNQIMGVPKWQVGSTVRSPHKVSIQIDMEKIMGNGIIFGEIKSFELTFGVELC